MSEATQGSRLEQAHAAVLQRMMDALEGRSSRYEYGQVVAELGAAARAEAEAERDEWHRKYLEQLDNCDHHEHALDRALARITELEEARRIIEGVTRDEQMRDALREWAGEKHSETHWMNQWPEFEPSCSFCAALPPVEDQQ